MQISIRSSVAIFFFTLFVPLMCVAARPFDDCLAENKSCMKSVIAFLRTDAEISDKRERKILNDLSLALQINEKSALDRDEKAWRKIVRRKCMAPKATVSINDALDMWGCLNWERDLRAVTLDQRLASLLEKGPTTYWQEGEPIHLSRTRLDIEYGIGEYTTATGNFDLTGDVDGIYSLSFSTPGANGHQCEGTAMMKRNGHTLTLISEGKAISNLNQQSSASQDRSHTEQSVSEECNLAVDVFPSHVKLDGNYACNELFSCGERAGTSGIFFR